MDVCDKAKQSTDEARNYLKAIIKRLNNTDPHIGLQAATVINLYLIVFVSYIFN